MKVKDLVSFSKDNFFNGAVQTEWFYDPKKLAAVAESYVFHGPKYYGVSTSDVNTGEHRLMDTASFAKTITNKLYSHTAGNCFVMTIAGYGTGKSHLAVCLGALFSGNRNLIETITNNISSADSDIGAYIKRNNVKKNLVIVLNGMNNFNLDAEILRCARLSLAQHGLSDDLLRKLTKSYSVARHFVERTFSLYKDQFEETAQQFNITLHGQSLKDYLISHVEDNSRVLTIINTVYTEVNGDSISWDRGLSAGDILLTLQEELCGEGKPFNKVLLLFDEFGRYIEYTAANPAIAGEAALQQIFEAGQSSNGNIVFVGFIQNELEAYLARIEKTSNITRYLERYRTASENLFLSSNFETILANVLKKSPSDFTRIVGGSISHYRHYHLQNKASLMRWDRSSTKKSVWTSDELYENVILNGCYPLHPLTVWLLSSSHQWMQQRSTLAFASEMFDTIAEKEIHGPFLPYVFPYQIVDSGIFSEMLNSEEKGLVSSQYCMLYRDILVKVGDKLSDLEKIILKSVLVINMGRMAFYNKEDAIKAIQLCSNCKEDEIQYALKSLEEMHGVVAFDEHSKTYDLIAEANGFNEFKRIFARYRIGVNASIDDIDEDVLTLITLDTPVETAFAQSHYISSTEWTFTKRLIDSRRIQEAFLQNAIRNISENCDGENSRGLLLYAYCSENVSTEIERLSCLYRKFALDQLPIIILFLDDSEKEMLSALTVKKALQKFSSADQDRFRKHILDQRRTMNSTLCRTFTSCVGKRNLISAHGLKTYTGRINALCSKKFDDLYTKAVPFVFDGFENKSKTQAKTTLTQICCYLYSRLLMNEQGYNSLSAKDKNRVKSTLSLSSTHAWKVFNSNCQLVEPGNPIIAEIIADITNSLSDGERHSVYQLFYKFVQPPYGMNDNSISLLVSYFIAFHENQYLYYYGPERLTSKHWSTDRGKHKIPEIRKISIQKNANANIDVVSELCGKILSNTSIAQCSALKNQLAVLVEQEGETDTNKYKVAQANAYLDEGIRLQKSFSEQLSIVRNHLTALENNFEIISFVKIFDMIPVISNPIESGLDYIYTAEEKDCVLHLQLAAHQLLKRMYLPSLKRLTFKFEELSENQKKYRRAAKILRDNSCTDYADATERRLTEIEASLRAKQKYESSFVECEKELIQSKTISKYSECTEMESKLEGWIDFFQSANELPLNAVSPLVDRIKAVQYELNLKKTALLDLYTSTIRKASTAESVLELRQVLTQLQDLLQMQLDPVAQKTMIQVQSDVTEAIKIIDSLPQDLDSLFDCIRQKDYAHNYCANAIECATNALHNELSRKQTDWIKTYIENVEQHSERLSSLECQNWIRKTSSVPTYLDSCTLERFHKTQEIVEARLHSSRVESLIAMYDKLSQSEKEAFRKLLAFH